MDRRQSNVERGMGGQVHVRCGYESRVASGACAELKGSTGTVTRVWATLGKIDIVWDGDEQTSVTFEDLLGGQYSFHDARLDHKFQKNSDTFEKWRRKVKRQNSRVVTNALTVPPKPSVPTYSPRNGKPFTPNNAAFPELPDDEERQKLATRRRSSPME